MAANNKDCKITKVETYKDCKGECFEFHKEVDPPLEKLPDLIPPLDLDFTLGTEKYSRAKVVRNMYKKKDGAMLHVREPLRVGDIIEVKDSCKKYFLKKKLKRRDKFNNFVFVVERLDGIFMNYLDYQLFKKDTLIYTKGYLKEKNKH